MNEDVDQSDITAVNLEHQAAADALLVGRNTFESFREFWAAQPRDPTGVAAYLNAVHKYVVSSTLRDPGWKNSTVLGGPVVEEVRALKETPGRDIVVSGSTQLVHTLIAAELGRRVPHVRLSRGRRPRGAPLQIGRAQAPAARDPDVSLGRQSSEAGGDQVAAARPNALAACQPR